MDTERKTATGRIGVEMDFLARSFALMESQGRWVVAEQIAGNMSREQRNSFEERLTYYRDLLDKSDIE